LLAGTGTLAVLIGFYAFLRPPVPGAFSPFVVCRPVATSLAMAFFAYWNYLFSVQKRTI